MKKAIAGLTLLMVVQMACAFIAGTPTATPTLSPTSVPPTATATATATPKPTPIPPTDTPELPSEALASSSLVSVMFTVVNRSSEKLELEWVDWQGNRGGTATHYATIAAGANHEQQTYFADGWVLRDQAGNIVLLFFATEETHRTLTISEAAVALAKKNALTDRLNGSIPGSDHMPIANVKFVNISSETVYVYWVDVNGASHSIDGSAIAPGGETEVSPIQYGDMFHVNDEEGNLILFYNATEEEVQTVTISDVAVSYRFGLNP